MTISSTFRCRGGMRRVPAGGALGVSCSRWASTPRISAKADADSARRARFVKPLGSRSWSYSSREPRPLYRQPPCAHRAPVVARFATRHRGHRPAPGPHPGPGGVVKLLPSRPSPGRMPASSSSVERGPTTSPGLEWGVPPSACRARLQAGARARSPRRGAVGARQHARPGHGRACSPTESHDGVRPQVAAVQHGEDTRELLVEAAHPLLMRVGGLAARLLFRLGRCRSPPGWAYSGTSSMEIAGRKGPVGVAAAGSSATGGPRSSKLATRKSGRPRGASRSAATCCAVSVCAEGTGA